MKLTILGTRGEIHSSAPHHRLHSGILLDDFLLLDMGEKTFLKYQPEIILITHLHPDHAFFVKQPFDLSVLKSKIFLPELPSHPSHNMALLTNKINFNSFKVTPIPTFHSLRVKSQGYLITKGNEKILYTGDLIAIDKRYEHLLDNLNMVITEASYIRKNGLVRKDKLSGEGYGHTGIPNLIEYFKKYTSHILFTHFGSWFYKDMKKAREQIKLLADSSGITAHIGYDGMKLETEKLIL